VDLLHIDLHPTNLADAQRTIAALVEENARLRDLAFTDELTNLMKRGPVLDRLARELRVVAHEKRAPKDGVESMAVVAVDLVGFKSINNSGGHDAGDAALVRTAGALAGAVRQNDLVARWGGDEFVLVLWNISLEDAAMVLGRAREAIQAIDERMDARLGCVVWERPMGPVEASALITAADMNELKLRSDGLAGALITLYEKP
jgi:diguanylate cyclase (GGDEF)-like protein